MGLFLFSLNENGFGHSECQTILFHGNASAIYMRVVQNPFAYDLCIRGLYVNFIESKHAKHCDRVSNAVVCVRECVSLRVF